MRLSKQRHDLIIQEVMQKINEVARVYKITILLIAHYAKIRDRKPINDDFKD
jgi:hypothetical protein